MALELPVKTLKTIFRMPWTKKDRRVQSEIRMLAPDRFYVPPEMQAFAEKSVEQTRQAFNSFIAAAYLPAKHSKARPRAPAKAPRMSLKQS
jgi:hypothetical protein